MMNTNQRTSGLSQARRGFTLVELLVVITIIGAIAALAIPAIGRVMRTVRVKAMRAEMTNITGGIDNYYTKYGDYPPDFSDWNIVKRHYLKIFPDIATSELNLLYRLCDVRDDNDNTSTPPQMTPNPQNINFDPTAMDRSEVIVWSLGGFSADPQFPFTGPGGPLVRLPGTATLDIDDPSAYEYNPTRNAPEIDFQADRLSLETFDPSQPKSFANRNRSNDEANGGRLDIFPHYILRSGSAPVVYFDSRTYNSFAPNTLGSPAPPVQMNGYARIVDGDFDAVRPVFSDTANNPPSTTYQTYPAAAEGWQFINPRTYQVLAPGLDGLFGDVADFNGGDPRDADPAYYRIDGEMIVLDPDATDPNLLYDPATPQGLRFPNVSRFDVTAVLPSSANAFRDNMANFLPEGTETFEDTLP